MLSKKEIKYIQSLSHKKFREELKVFIAEGPKIVGELVEQIPHQIERIYATREWMDERNTRNSPLPVTEITEQELEKITQLQAPNQVLALVDHLEYREPDEPFFTIYLDNIRDPGNFGTILRIADWFNVKDIVCSMGCAEVYNPKVVQSSMASIARVNVFYDEKDEWLQKQTIPVYAASLHGVLLNDHEKVDRGILIIGNESTGIRPEVMRYATEKITIPKKGSAESLNAAVATGIILYHLLN